VDAAKPNQLVTVRGGRLVKYDLGHPYRYKSRAAKIDETVTLADILQSEAGVPEAQALLERSDGSQITGSFNDMRRLHGETYPDVRRGCIAQPGTVIDGSLYIGDAHYARSHERLAAHSASADSRDTLEAAIFTRYVGTKRQLQFNHSSEIQLARTFDRYGIDWDLEREFFELSEFGFLPDFYLPELDLYVEVTSRYGRLPKARKLNAMAAERPDVRVISLGMDLLTEALDAPGRDELLALLEDELDRERSRSRI
jgi:hypothetical protein